MGISYSHLVLFGPDQEAICAAVADRQAAVSPSIDGFTLLADLEFDSLDTAANLGFCSELSKMLSCPAILISEYDDDVLCYVLIEEGSIFDHYNSSPDYFDFQARNSPPRGPEGGDAVHLCTVLKRPDAAAIVAAILRDPDLQLSATDRHRKLAGALNMPSFCVGFGYDGLQNGEYPEGLDVLKIVFTSETEI
jgi:hypothetical protein